MSEASYTGASAGTQVDPDHPWLGLRPFTEETASYFFGRTEAIREIFLMVREHALTILFGESGLGKTSLLEAGLVPKLQVEGYHPIRVLLDFSDSARAVVQQVRWAMAGALAANGLTASDWQERWAPLATLWEIFAHRELRAPDSDVQRLILIFDQFEEIFTLAGDKTGADSRRAKQQSQVHELMNQLADLLENRPPIALQESFRKDRSRARIYDTRCRLPRVVLSLREDYLSELEAWKAVMPSLMRNRMPLRPLTGLEALEAVVEPGRKGTHPLVSKEVGEVIVRHVARVQKDVPLEQIEAVPPLISLLCERLNAARIATKQDYISAELVTGESEDILEQFYNEVFEELPEPTRSIARKFVEEELLTIGGHRKPVPWEDALNSLDGKGMSEPRKVLDDLIRGRLLTSERRGGLACIEITHDVLAPLVARSRDGRHKLEAQEREENQRLEAEARSAYERRRRYREELYKRRFVRSLADEEFWTKLLDEVEAGRVRPVLGAQVVTLAPDDIPLDAHTALELPVRLRIPDDFLPPNPSLKQIAAATILQDDEGSRFYPELRRVLEDPSLVPGTILRTLAALAGQSTLPLFFTTTPDQLLERALRSSGKTVEVAAFHPGRPEDIRPTGAICVYHLFGIARNFPACAISSEDTLDYAISFSRHLSDLHRLQREFIENSLLILGLGLSDWLTRILLRVGLGRRFADRSGGRWMSELTSLAELAENPSENFPNSTVLFVHRQGETSAIPAEPVQFVLELDKRLLERKQRTGVQTHDLTSERLIPEKNFIYISYASEDRDSVARMTSQLQEVGLQIWSGSSRRTLLTGDNWARESYEGITRCGLFISIISRYSESASDRYFWRERAWAAERQQQFDNGQIFYLPIVVDDIAIHEIRREAIFLSLRIARAPGGHLSNDELNHICQLMRRRRRDSI